MRVFITLVTAFIFATGLLFSSGQEEMAEMVEEYEPDLPDEDLWPEDELGPQPEFPELAGEEVELTVSVHSEGITPYLSEFAENFEELFGYIDLTVNVQQIPFDQLHDSLASQLVAGTGAPDVVGVEVGQTSRFFVPPFETEFMDLDLSGELPDTLARQELYRDTNGRQTGVEVADAHPGFLYYRQDIFDEAGVDIEDIETWDDYLDAGEQIMEETGAALTAVGFEAESSDWELLSLAVQNGNPIYDSNGDFVLNDSATLEVIERLVEGYDRGIIVDEFSDDDSLIQRYLGSIEPQVASMIAPNWYFNGRIGTGVEESNWRMAPAPTFENTDNETFTWGGTSVAVVESQTDYPELAEAFVIYSLSTRNQIRKFEITGFLPVTQPALDSDTFLSHTEPDIFGDQPIGEMNAEAIGNLPPLSLGETFPDVSEEIVQTFGNVLDDPQGFLDDLEEFEAELRE